MPKITVFDGDTVIGKVTADQRGEFVLIPDKPLQPGNRSLSLSERFLSACDTAATRSVFRLAMRH